MAEATSRRFDNDDAEDDPDRLASWLAEMAWFGLRGVRAEEPEPAEPALTGLRRGERARARPRDTRDTNSSAAKYTSRISVRTSRRLALGRYANTRNSNVTSTPATRSGAR